MGLLIKPVEIRLVREMSPGRILIGYWAERLVRVRKLWMLGMLHWGYSSEIWVSGCFQVCFQMLLAADDTLSLPSGPHLPGEFASLCCRRMIFFVVVSGRGGGQVRDPIEAAFQERSIHNNDNNN